MKPNTPAGRAARRATVRATTLPIFYIVAEGTVTRSSPYTVAETLDRLRAAIQSRNLTIFAKIDHAEAARQVGLAMRPAHVLIFGSPKAGTPLMNAAPLLALDLPLKLLVWQSANEQV